MQPQPIISLSIFWHIKYLKMGRPVVAKGLRRPAMRHSPWSLWFMSVWGALMHVITHFSPPSFLDLSAVAVK